MEYLVKFLLETVFVVIYLLAFIFAGGLIIDFLEKKSNKNLMQAVGYTGIVITGLGTVIHELSHLIMGLIGGMKPVEVKLFRPIKGRKDGKLGYVISSYNKKNYYQKMFLVLVGIAPIIGGTIVMLIVMRICLPETFSILIGNIKSIENLNAIINADFIVSIFSLVINLLKGVFNLNNFSNISFWVFMFVVLSIASHMSLSYEDIKGCLKGIPALYLLILLINLVVITVGVDLNVVIDFITTFNVYVIIFLSIAVVFSIINWVITLMLFNCVKIFKI